MKHLRKSIALLLALAMLLSCPVIVHAADSSYNWVSTWGTAEEKCDINADRMPQMALNGSTVRQIIRVTTTGDVMKLTFSNQYGGSDVVIRSLHIAKQVQADRSTIDLSTDTVVTVGGKEEFTIKAGQTIETDPVEFHVDALDNIAVSTYFGSAPSSNITGHRGARATTYQISGNNVSTETFASAQTKTTTSWFFLSDVALDMPAGSKAVVCFGDSITDGYGTDADYLGKKPDSYTRWGDYFAKRLQANDATKNISVINEGIGSNSLLGSYPTDAGKDRFARDLLEHDGVGYVIIHFGVNDLQKLSNTNKYNQMITEFKKMIDLAHDNGIAVYVAPILPFQGSSDYYSAASEQLRVMINDWFRSPEAEVDGIIDFESAVVDPSRPTYLRSEYTHSDGLHPYDGYSAMADAIDLSLFTGAGLCDHEYVPEVIAPTCVESGYTQYVCSKCGNTRKGDVTAALGHDWDEGTVTVAATETTPGVLTIACKRCDATKTKRIPRVGATVPDDIDFTDPASADRFEIVNQTETSIREGQGLYLITTKDAFEPANDQLSGTAATTPKDLVLIPVEGDWAATMEFSFNQGGASNGYYQFFGFYAMQDYQNAAGIRGGNNDLQNFLRVGGAVTADTDGIKSAPGLGSNGTYWFKLVKEGTTYTCLRSSDGEEFTEMFAYEDTGIEAEHIAIDAYTGMTTGYQFYVKSLKFEDVGGPQAFKVNFVCDEHATVTVYDSQAEDSPKTEKAAFAYARNSETGEIDISGDGQVNFVIVTDEGYEATVTAEPNNYKNLKLPTETGTGYRLTKVTGDVTVTVVTEKATCEHDYAAVVTAPTCTEKGYTTYTCTKCGDSYKADETAKLPHSFENGVCTVCGLKAFVISFDCAAGASVTVYESQAEDSPKAEKAATAYARNGDTGEIDVSSDGQVNFDVVVAPGYVLKEVTAEPKNYKNLKLPEETGTGYRITKISGDFTVTVTTEKDPDYVCDGGEFCPAKGYTDAPKAGTWAHAGIDYCIENSLMNGMSATLFKPNGTVTRGQLVTILYRIAGKPEAATEKSFTDVEAGRYYTEAVLWAAEKGIVNGYNDGTFKPENPISREQIATILYRYSDSPDVTGELDFPDAKQVGNYAKDALLWATQRELITGVKTTDATILNPKANATRAQIATIIMRYLEAGK